MIGFIGTGKMGSALISGAIKVFGQEYTVFYDPSENTQKAVTEQYGITACHNNRDLVRRCDIIVLAVKPQILFKVLEEIKLAFDDEPRTVISIAPGITTAQISSALDHKAQVVRVMPNTPAMVGEGMCAISFAEGFKGDADSTMKLFNAVGRTVILHENLMNASVVANGSSPAFVFIFIEALADGAVKYGIPRDKAYEMAAQTVLGSAKLMLETGKTPAELKDAVCSPGGTTICGTAVLEENNFRGAVIKACDAVFEKTQNMEK
ncbi:MAG: pyrroline-5-carboxylate reductase [Lachnospiraceae bacterium]|nr:pyrroline-5-carboxylate reductase [Lachnospiraceae bacterium]